MKQLQNLKQLISYPPDPSTELAGFRISVNDVAVLFEDFITGRGKLPATTAVHRYAS